MKDFIQTGKSAIITFTHKYPFLAYFFLAIVVMWPLSLGIYALQYDAVDVYLPWRFYGSESLRQGMVPLWNPFQDGGYPFYGDHQYSIWNPELFIISQFTRFNASTIQWLYIFYLAIGGLGFRFLLKQLKMDRSVLFVGGVLFMLSGVLVGHAQSVVSVLGAVWLPWALGAYLKAINNHFKGKDILQLVLFMFLMLSSGYQAVSIMLFYVILALGGYTLFSLIKEKSWKDLRRFILGHFLTGLGLAILMAGIVISLMEVFPYLSRLTGITLEESQLVHFHPQSLWSFLYPLASVQEGYEGTAISMQNIFSGVFVFFLLFFAFKGLKKKVDGQLAILLIFGIIYGLASFGPYTPIQPFFYKFIPGCDQFYYSAFYRFFGWIALLIIVCIGLQNYLNRGKLIHLQLFLAAIVILFGVSAGIYWSNWDAMDVAFSGKWSTTFRAMEWGPAILLESLIHGVLALIFLLVLFFYKSRNLVVVFIVIELAVISQLNIPVTVHGEIRTETINQYLASKKEGFFIPNNAPNMAHNDKFGMYGSIWRNQGNFTNLPSLNGWTSFHLVGREEVLKRDEEMRNFLPTKSYAYLKNSDEPILIDEFSPDEVNLQLKNVENADTLIVQNAHFPGWSASIDGKEAETFLVNQFEQGLLIPAGSRTVQMKYENKRIVWLYYLSSFGFLLVLFLYFINQQSFGTMTVRASVFGVVFIIIIVRTFLFSPTPSKGFKLTAGGHSLEHRTNLSEADYEKTVQFLIDNKGEVRYESMNMDADSKLLALLCYLRPQTKRLDNSHKSFTKGAFIDDTTRIEIPAKGYYNIDLQDYISEDSNLDGYLTFGFDVHDEASVDYKVIIEVKEDERTLYYGAFPMNYAQNANGRRIFADSYLLPDLCGDRQLKMYLWNNSAMQFTFSNFRAKIIE